MDTEEVKGDFETVRQPPNAFLLETVSQFTEPVIPDERRFAGRDPESSESDEL